MSGRLKEDMDCPLRKRLADLEVRRNTLIETMSKFQDAKKSALFQYLKDNCEEEVCKEMEIFSSSNADGDENPSQFIKNEVRQEANVDRNYCFCERDSVLDTCHHANSEDLHSYTEIHRAREEKLDLRLRLPPTSNSSGIPSFVNDDTPKEKPSPTMTRSCSGRSEKLSRTRMPLTAQYPENPAYRDTERHSFPNTQRTSSFDRKRNIFKEKVYCSSTIEGKNPNRDSSNIMHAPYSERTSLALSNGQQKCQSIDTTSCKNILHRLDAGPTQSIVSMISSSEKKYEEEFFQHLSLKYENEAPFDESISYDDNSDGSIVFPNAEENSNDGNASMFQDQQRITGGTTYFKNGNFGRAQSNRNTSLTLINTKKEYSVLTREENIISASKSAVDSDEDIIRTESSMLPYFNTLDHQKATKDEITRSTAKIIFEDEKLICNKHRETCIIEDKFLNLFVEEEGVISTKDVGNSELIESQRNLHGHQVSTEEQSKNLRGNITNDFRVGYQARTTKGNGTNSNDQMTLLEIKLNMMVSKKPLWQKALQDLYKEPFGDKVSLSKNSSGMTKTSSEAKKENSADTPSVTTPAGIGFHRRENEMKNENNIKAAIKIESNKVKKDTVESRDENICSIDSPGINVMTGIDLYLREKEIKNPVDSKADAIVQGGGNDVGDYTDARDSMAEKAESCRIQSICAIDSPLIDSPTRLNLMPFKNERNHGDSRAEMMVGKERIETRNYTRDGDSTEIDFVELQHIQNAKNYLEILPGCLSDLKESVMIADNNEAESEIEIDSSEIAQKEPQNHSLRREIEVVQTAENEDTGPLDEKQIVSTHDEEQYNIQMTYIQSKKGNTIEEKNIAVLDYNRDDLVNAQKEVEVEAIRTVNNEDIAPPDKEHTMSMHPEQQFKTTNVQSNQSSRIGEKNKSGSETEKDNLGHLEDKNKTEFVQMVYSDDISLLDEKHMVSMHAAHFQLDHSSSVAREIKTELKLEKYSFGNSRKEIEIESMQTVDSKDIAKLDKKQMISRDIEKRQAHSIYFQPSRENGREIGSLIAAASNSMSIPQVEEQMIPRGTQEQHIHSIYSQPSQRNQIQIEPLRATVSEDIVSVNKRQIIEKNSEQQTMHLQSSQRKVFEIQSPRTTENKNVTVLAKEQVTQKYPEQYTTYFQSNELETISPAAFLKTPPTSNSRKPFFSDTRHILSDSDKLGQTNILNQSVMNSSNYFDCGVASDLSDDSTNSLAASSSAFSLGQIEIEDDENDDVGDQVSEESSMKPPIPNEVTMLTDFTVQSITYASNNSVIESLGDESLVRGIKSNEKSGSNVMSHSNSESTVVGEKNIVEQSVGALQMIKHKVSYAEGLLDFFNNPSLLCQCTGPVVLGDVGWSRGRGT